MITKDDVVKDMKVFIDQWAVEQDKFESAEKELNKKYNVKPHGIFDDEYMYGFKIDDIVYGWDWNREELYLDGDENTPAITSGLAFEYIIQYDKILTDAYKNVEYEMEKHGWVNERDEYAHNLYKDGWTTDLSYWTGGCDFDDAVGEIEFYGEDK